MSTQPPGMFNPKTRKTHRFPSGVYLSSVQNPWLTFHYTDWFIGILILAYEIIPIYLGRMSSPISNNQPRVLNTAPFCTTSLTGFSRKRTVPEPSPPVRSLACNSLRLGATIPKVTRPLVEGEPGVFRGVKMVGKLLFLMLKKRPGTWRCPLFFGLNNPPKQGPFPIETGVIMGHLGSRYIYDTILYTWFFLMIAIIIYIYVRYRCRCIVSYLYCIVQFQKILGFGGKASLQKNSSISCETSG